MPDSKQKDVITIGIPCYAGVTSEVLSDYMRFAYYLGRRYQEYDFFLAIKSKSEQFRARNAIVEAAMQVGSKYLLMIDDDHVIDTDDYLGVSDKYEFLRKLITHMENNHRMGVIGVLYYHRGNECRPVLMKEGIDGKFYYMNDSEITNGLQQVDIQGGGCMLLNMQMFEEIPYPWFEPELSLGTDIQISTKAKKYDWTVYSDTSIEIGHIMNAREIVTSKNRHRMIGENVAKGNSQMQFEDKMITENSIALLREDAELYLGVDIEGMELLSEEYREAWKNFDDFDDKDDYYRSAGKAQVARQIIFHHNRNMIEQLQFVCSLVTDGNAKYGIEYGCGTAPVGMELAMRGHRMDLIDVPGSPAWEFAKWRAKHRHIENRVGWELAGPYDFALFLDSIEHFTDWQTPIKNVVDRIKPNGCIITNYFINTDFENKEHINMDSKKVWQYLVSLDVYPLNHIVWIKRDINAMCKRRKDDVGNTQENNLHR